MYRTASSLSLKLAAPSMVFGNDLLTNVRILTSIVDHIEIVLFHTPSLNNLPTPREIDELKQIGRQEDISFSVHLPSSLEIACLDRQQREESLQLARKILFSTEEFNPIHYVFHIPYSRPTLTSVPGKYIKACDKRPNWDEWTQIALGSVESLYKICKDKLLVENINYAPVYLEPFWKSGFCGFCLDIGHLMLGGEDVLGIIEQYMCHVSEIHLHGVESHDEHLSCAVLSEKLLQSLVSSLIHAHFRGILNIEVFNPYDLTTSLAALQKVVPKELTKPA